MRELKVGDPVTFTVTRMGGRSGSIRTVSGRLTFIDANGTGLVKIRNGGEVVKHLSKLRHRDEPSELTAFFLNRSGAKDA